MKIRAAIYRTGLTNEIYPTDDGLLAIERANYIVVLLSVDQVLAVIGELRAYYDTRAQWQQANPA